MALTREVAELLQQYVQHGRREEGFDLAHGPSASAAPRATKYTSQSSAQLLRELKKAPRLSTNEAQSQLHDSLNTTLTQAQTRQPLKGPRVRYRAWMGSSLRTFDQVRGMNDTLVRAAREKPKRHFAARPPSDTRNCGTETLLQLASSAVSSMQAKLQVPEAFLDSIRALKEKSKQGQTASLSDEENQGLGNEKQVDKVQCKSKKSAETADGRDCDSGDCSPSVARPWSAGGGGEGAADVMELSDCDSDAGSRVVRDAAVTSRHKESPTSDGAGASGHKTKKQARRKKDRHHKDKNRSRKDLPPVESSSATSKSVSPGQTAKAAVESASIGGPIVSEYTLTATLSDKCSSPAGHHEQQQQKQQYACHLATTSSEPAGRKDSEAERDSPAKNTRSNRDPDADVSQKAGDDLISSEVSEKEDVSVISDHLNNSSSNNHNRGNDSHGADLHSFANGSSDIHSSDAQDDTNEDNVNPDELELDIFQAAEIGDLDVVERFLNADPALLNAQDPLGKRTPLDIACAGGSLDLAKYLLARHASVEERNSQGGQPIHSAVIGGHLDVLRLLHAMGSSLDAVMEPGLETVLHTAVSHGQVDCLRYLVANGADATLVDSRGRSALQLAHLCGESECGQILQDYISSGVVRTNQKEKHALDLWERRQSEALRVRQEAFERAQAERLPNEDLLDMVRRTSLKA